MVERADRAAVGTFYAPGAWESVVELGEAAAHHVHVKRLCEGDAVRLTSGDGRRAAGTLSAIRKRDATVTLDAAAIEQVPAPYPIALLVPIGDRDRMLMLAEKAVELGLSSWCPVSYRRSRSVSPRGEGEAFRDRTRLRMISALEQSGGAWLPEFHADSAPEEARARCSGRAGILLDTAGAPLAGLATAHVDGLAIALGPEGGLEPDERAAFLDAGWQPVSLGDNVLRFETAGIAALAIARTLLR